MLDAHLSSNEETIFGNWLEGLAIFINGKVYGGKKAGMGIDLDFTDENGVRYIVSIKSGPNWGNSEQIKRMRDTFNKEAKAIRSSNSKIHVVAVNGCCYGRDNNPDKGDYFKYCGQRFWKFISGNADLYTDIIEPLGHQAKANTDIFQEAYGRVLNQFTSEFMKLYCNADFSIDWKKLTKHNSSESTADIIREAKPKRAVAKEAAEDVIEESEELRVKPRRAVKAVKRAGPVKKKVLKKPVKKTKAKTPKKVKRSASHKKKKK